MKLGLIAILAIRIAVGQTAGVQGAQTTGVVTLDAGQSIEICQSNLGDETIQTVFNILIVHENGSVRVVRDWREESGPYTAVCRSVSADALIGEYGHHEDGSIRVIALTRAVPGTTTWSSAVPGLESTFQVRFEGGRRSVPAAQKVIATAMLAAR